MVFNGGCRRLGEQHLAPMGSGADAGHLVHGEVDIMQPDWAGLACVRPDPHPYLGSRWPRVGRERPLGLETGGDRFGGIVEDKEERVSLGIDLNAAMLDEVATKQRLVGCQQLHIPIAELTEEAGRALYVGHDERDHPGGQARG